MKQNFKLFLLTVLGIWMAGSAWAEEHYLVGGCTDSGWNTGSYHRIGVAMQKINSYTWVWYGKLTVGEGDAGRFKILNGIDSWSGYWAPSQGTVLTSDWSDLSTESDGDYKFCVSEEGLYKVTIKITETEKKIKAEKLTNEPSKDGDYYLIGSVADFCWFAAYIATNETNASKARLTADLDFSTDGFFPLASDKHKFKGEIDGAGHTLKGINVVEDYGFTALVRYATNGTNIHDLVIEGSFSGGRKVAGVIGFARDGGEITLTNVVNKANVTATRGADGDEGNAAGLVACATDKTKITALNCANMGEVRGQDGQCAAFIGWSQPETSFTNCWNSGAISNIEGNAQLYRNSGVVSATNCYDLTEVGNQGTKLAANTISTADFCYQLNSNVSGGTDWRLTIGTDAHPYPFDGHGIVYANGYLYCDGTTKPGTVLENEEKESVRDAHNYNPWGFCQNKPNGTDQCNELNTNFISPAGDGYYEIATKEQLNWFAVRVNGHDTYHSHTDAVRNINGKLTADIDFSDQTNMIGGDGNSTGYQGTFDGQGHKVTLGYNVSQKNVALFRTLASANIKNLVTDGTIRNENNSCAGGIFAGSHGASVVENCVSYVSLNRNNGGDATFGGIGAYMHDNGKIENCAFYGSINASESNGNAGILGYANGGDNIKLTNCVIDATLSYTNGDLFARNTSSLTNCYYVNTGKTNASASATEVTADQVGNGELAYFINGNKSTDVIWYQKLGEDADAEPLPFGTYVVYANGDLYCDGTAKGTATYSNVEGANRDAHNYGEWGFCTNKNGSDVVCDEINPAFVTLTDGFYQIGNAKELNWFAVWTNRKDAAVNAKLTADIDMTEVANFPGIGTNDHRYAGTFDGQKHKISNLTMNFDQQGVGMINCAGVGVVVKNLLIDNTCSFTGSEGVAAFIGGLYGTGGTALIENCGNEATVNATSKNAGALLGCNYANNENRLSIINCYNTGDINSNKEGGALSGWVHNEARVINCYNTGALTGCEGFIRGFGEHIFNCFSTSNTKSETYGRAADNSINNISDGGVFAVLYAFNEDGVDGNVWRMDYDAATPHPVLYGDAIAMREDCANRMIEGSYDVTLYRTIKQGGWNTFCVPFDMTSAQITEYFGAGTEVAELDVSKNDLDDDVLHFKLVDEIEAGKAYLVYPGVVEDFSSKAIEGVTISATSPQEDITQAGFTFKGVYEPTELVADKDRIVVSGNKIVKTTGGSLNGFRAYFKPTDANARATRFVIDDDNEVTGIITAEGEVIMDQPVYNLRGQRVQEGNSSSRGLLIKGGKKYVKM